LTASGRRRRGETRQIDLQIDRIHWWHVGSRLHRQVGVDLCFELCFWFATAEIPQGNRLSITYSIEARPDTLEELTHRLTQTPWFDSDSIE